jgi:hypothetical protein
MRACLAIVAAFAFLGFLFTFFLEASLNSRASLVQFVRSSPTGLKSGGLGYEAIGPPQRVVLDDPNAFLPGYAAPGVRLANVDVLKARGLSPLHLETVQLTAWYARIGCVLAMVASSFGAVFLGKTRKV